MRSILKLSVQLRWTLPSCSYSQGISLPSAKIVCTTGYSFMTPSGVRMSKYGIYFGDQDDRNVLEEGGPGTTHVGAKIQAVTKAIQLASSSDEPVTIRTDFKLKGDYRSLLKEWATRDFLLYKTGAEMANAPLLRKLHEALAASNVTLEFCPAHEHGEKNYVTDLIMKSSKFRARQMSQNDFPAHVLGVPAGAILNGAGNWLKSQSNNWPLVYVGAIYFEAKNGYTVASFCSYWPSGNCGGGLAHRLSMFPVTLFRAQLAGIEEALIQVVECGLPQVLLKTDSPHFMKYYSSSWRMADGAPAPNKFMYDRILNLATQRGVEVRFCYEPSDSQSVEWKTVEERCEEGLSFPLTARSRDEYDLSLEEMTEQQCSSALAGSGITRVRVFKKGTDLPPGSLWDTVDADESFECEFDAMPSGSVADIVLSVLTKLSCREEKSVVVRTDSSRLIRACESWLPVWKRCGWRNSKHKLVADWQKWQQIDTLRKQIKIYWELMDPPSDSDVKLVMPFKKPVKINS